LSGILATSVMPLLELCGFITDDQVRSMASLDHPAMRDLMLTAPGTYHHSLVVSSLVEASAREIGADYLLAKTAALYHDIGKMKKPDYFVENQGNMPNRHDKLAPSMSALILISHIKDGVDLAVKYRLSKAIQDIIIQHHGTRLISYFYSKAMEACKNASLPEPAPENFRYPGPKPQTREAGLVMLADIVEAASRSLNNPTPARLQGLVKQQINEVFMAGQLDECELTLKDLNRIAKLFNTILSGIYHHRIDYPDDKKEDKKPEEKKPNADNNKQPAKKLSPVPGVNKNALA
jgi:putative nucleotidyltransferase with HDIG domain